MIMDGARTLVLNSVIAQSIDNIDVISVENATGEFFRKAYLSKETISATERKYGFYLTEDEGNDDITGLALWGNGATTTLASGVEMATQEVTIPKTNTQSLLVHWYIKVVV